MRTFSRWSLLLAFAGVLAAFDQPAGVGGFIEPPQPGAPCGGSLVAIAPGQALTLAEALPPGDGPFAVAFAGRRGLARIERRGLPGGAVLLRLSGVNPPALALADSHRAAIGLPVWTAANAVAAVVDDGLPAISSGIVSGAYRIPAEAPPVRGRGGRPLSEWRGPVLETDAAINEGSQGGALLDGDGRVLGLLSLGGSRERRMGSVVPLQEAIDGLGLALPLAPPAGVRPPLAELAQFAAPCVVAIYWERPAGPGNPTAVPRPVKSPEQVPAYERERLQAWWDSYYHQQQVFYADHAVPAIVISDRELVTSASNLHGGAEVGRVLFGGRDVAVQVKAVDRALDLALVVADKPLGVAPAEFSARRMAPGEALALIGRHGANQPPTITLGVVSADDRRRGQSPVGFIQFDAQANYASCGGALIGADGQVAGMATLMGPEGGRWLINSGVALAVGSGALQAALPRLREGLSRERAPTLGLGIRHDGESSPMKVVAVFPGTGAEAAGITAGDVLLTIDGRRFNSAEALSRMLVRRAIGDVVQLGLRRGDKELTLAVKLTVFE